MSERRNPWIDLPASPPYVLDADRELIERFNATAKPEHFVHFEHHPEPFLGRPDAPVVVLGLNPGYRAECDRWHSDPSFAARSRANLVHGELDYPFYLLDPREPAPGHRYWRQKLGDLIYETTLKDAARSVLCVEYFPYHSRRFAHELIRVPSQAYSFELVRAAVRRGAWIVRMRSERLWRDAVPELAHYPRLLRTRSVQNPTISQRNLDAGFADVVHAIRTGSVGPPLSPTQRTVDPLPTISTPAREAVQRFSPVTRRPTNMSGNLDAAGRDRTTFTLRFGTQVRRGVNKRKTIHAVVGHLINRGVPPAAIETAMVDRGSRTFFAVPGRFEAGGFITAALDVAAREGRAFDPDRWFSTSGELFFVDGVTYALSNQWGSHTFPPTIESLKSRFADADFDVTAE